MSEAHVTAFPLVKTRTPKPYTTTGRLVYDRGMTEMTAVESADQRVYLVELDESAGTIAFLDADTDERVADYRLATFAEVRGALALNVGAGRFLDDAAVAGVQQWARV